MTVQSVGDMISNNKTLLKHEFTSDAERRRSRVSLVCILALYKDDKRSMPKILFAIVEYLLLELAFTPGNRLVSRNYDQFTASFARCLLVAELDESLSDKRAQRGRQQHGHFHISLQPRSCAPVGKRVV